MSHEVWAEVYNRLATLISEHRTTLVFVNTRRLAERVTHQLCERLGKDKVTSHHGSLSAQLRLDAENRLKRGELKALVATASLELGIDIGSVDLVCQLGPTRSIATLLQRVGRAEHKRGGLPKGRIFPLSRDELVECFVTLRSVTRGELDGLEMPQQPLDVLAQQIVASAAVEDWEEERLFEMLRGAYPYRNLQREQFDDVLRMLAEGFSTKRGRRGALLHHDAVNHRIRARRGAGLIALTSGGAIPDNADYRVVVEPSETFIGTVNEDFAIESLAGDIFLLGNASWKILRVNSGQVRVEDAHGQPPNIPFWLGEAPGRTAELSQAISGFREEAQDKIETVADRPVNAPFQNHPSSLPEGSVSWNSASSDTQTLVAEATRIETEGDENEARHSGLNVREAEEAVTEWLVEQPGLPGSGARQLASYFTAAYKVLGVVPSQDKLVIERFFDESGGMQLVIHSPFGIRVNRAWGLALRKRFCRSFNFELQAAATDDAIVLSLGTQHSFPLDEVFRYLNSKTVRDLLVQALLDAPMFQIHWRWNASRALALPRQRGGRKIPPPLQRMESENLLAAVFPDQLACLENIVGDRVVPDHPLVQQTIEDCLDEAMDIDGLIKVLEGIEEGRIECIARDLPEPSPLAHEILNARPYAFLDDAPLEERRTHAVYTRRASEATSEPGLGVLDEAAIEKVTAEAWPRAANPDELHEALLLAGVMTESDPGRVATEAAQWLEILVKERRAGLLRLAREDSSTVRFWVAAERLPLVQAVYPVISLSEELAAPESLAGRSWEPADALRELVRGRMEVSGPIQSSALAALFGLPGSEIEAALFALEAEGFILRGKFRGRELEWCDRRLLARIHRLTINRLRAEIQPVSIAQFQRFLLRWQRLDPEHLAEGPEGVAAVLELLDGYDLPAAAWEPEVLARRIKDYRPQWLDQLCFTGRIGWGRLTPRSTQNGRPSGPVRSSPVAIFSRHLLSEWLALSKPAPLSDYSPDTLGVLEALQRRGALFFGELVKETNLLPSRVEQGLAELAAQGWVTSDSFEGLRALLVTPEKRRPFADLERKRRHKSVTSVEFAGRWSLLRQPMQSEAAGTNDSARDQSRQLYSHERDSSIEGYARSLLRRYGVVFRRLLERESLNASWFELGRVYRRMEAIGEIRGGHFVSGVSGEQFALSEAIGLLRSLRKSPLKGQITVISGADPLNLAGILSPGPRVTAITSNRLLLHDGVPIAALEGGNVVHLQLDSGESPVDIERALRIGKMPPALRPYYA